MVAKENWKFGPGADQNHSKKQNNSWFGGFTYVYIVLFYMKSFFQVSKNVELHFVNLLQLAFLNTLPVK